MEENQTAVAADSSISVETTNEPTITIDDASFEGYSVSPTSLDEPAEVKDEPAEVKDASEEKPAEAAVAGDVAEEPPHGLSKENIDNYFNSPEAYQEIHAALTANNPEYKAVHQLWSDPQALQNYLMQCNENFAASDDVNFRAQIMYEAKSLLEQQLQQKVMGGAAEYKNKILGYLAEKQLSSYLEQKGEELSGVKKLTGDLYDAIVQNANLPKNDETQAHVMDSINAVFLGLANQFNVNPKILVEVIEKFSNTRGAQAALDQLQDKSHLKLDAEARAKSITKGGADVNSKRNLDDDLFQQYAIN